MAGAQGEIIAAKRLFSDYGETLLADKALAPLLERYRRAIQNTCDLMGQAGVTTACEACAARVAGGCCFCGVEEWYDPVLLLINLLLGIRIPLSGEWEEGCLFVGPRGCKLRAKHSFCLNYLCPALKAGLQGEAENRLLSTAGEELLRGWELEQGIHSWLRRHWTNTTKSSGGTGKQAYPNRKSYRPWGSKEHTVGVLPCNSGSHEA